MADHALPLTPPTMWTAPQPAKSRSPEPKSTEPEVRLADSQPAPDHCQCTTTGYTNAVRKNEYTTLGGDEG